MTRPENTIFIRSRGAFYETFAKALGEGIMLSGFETEAEAIETTGHALFNLNKYGVVEYKKHLSEPCGQETGTHGYGVIRE